MPFVTRKSLLGLVLLATTAVVLVIGFIWSGLYNVGADDQHTRPVYAAMETLRKRSIAARASELDVPDLTDATRITQGAGNYDAMCTGCHLRPGMGPTELSQGLYPAPPDLTRALVDPGQAFWVIKHGIKASGMPAWGRSMDDAYIWNMVAFLQKLPTLTPAQYDAMVASSSGHSHGGGETQPHGHGDASAEGHDMPATASPPAGQETHPHPPGTPPHDDGAAAPRQPRRDGTADQPHPHPPGMPADHHEPAAPTVEHRHADGTVESHPASPEPKADDDHDHEH